MFTKAEQEKTISTERSKAMIDKWIAEATECDFKVALEIKKPKSWLKSVSAFANGIGGTLLLALMITEMWLV